MARITAGDIRNWSCTKLADFFDEKTPNWMVDNLTVEAVMALQLKLRQCSREIYVKSIPILRMVKHGIMLKKGREGIR